MSPEGAPPADCTLHSERVVWRIENGQAVLVASHVYRGPHGKTPTIPGTLDRSEYGIEISVALTVLVTSVRLSLDKVCEQFKFFWGLKLANSQADALLHRLARQWEPEFDTLCMLLANSAVVHADETGSSGPNQVCCTTQSICTIPLQMDMHAFEISITGTPPYACPSDCPDDCDPFQIRPTSRFTMRSMISSTWVDE